MKINYQVEKEFNPRLSVPNYNTYLNKSLRKAKIAVNHLTGQINLKYGNSSLQALDVFYNSKKANCPIHIFIHGGYWRALDKLYHTHMAVPFVKKDICFFNINYELCPNVKLTEIKEQVIKSIKWIYRNAKSFNANNQNIVLSGHSAGAHLASLMLTVDWQKYDINSNIFKGIGLISGIFDTEVVLNLKINKEIKLTPLEAKKNNSFRIKPKFSMPTIISYGEREPVLWKKQSINYRKFLNKNSFKCKTIICSNDNHFSLIDTLANIKHKLVKALIKLSFS